MTTDWQTVAGTVERGHQVASGLGESPYPQGTIAMQVPVFKQLGLDLTDFFPATLNISISPHTFKLVQPEFTFRQVEWTDKHPAEDFSFSHCRLIYRHSTYDGWVYYPHPETKQHHFQNPSIIEIIAPQIPEIRYGSQIEIELNAARIIVLKPTR